MGTIAVFFLVSLCLPLFVRTAVPGAMTRAVANCKKVANAVQLFASDNSGAYPDSVRASMTSSNDAFRQLFIRGVANNEMFFGCPTSSLGPDGNIGRYPDFEECLKPGENHWAMNLGLSDSASGRIPLIFENAINSDWPPRWKLSKNIARSRAPGESWPTNRIIVSLNDGSVMSVPLSAEHAREREGHREATVPELFESAAKTERINAFLNPALPPNSTIGSTNDDHDLQAESTRPASLNPRQLWRASQLGQTLLGVFLPLVSFFIFGRGIRWRQVILRGLIAATVTWFVRNLYSLKVQLPIYERAYANEIDTGQREVMSLLLMGWLLPLTVWIALAALNGAFRRIRTPSKDALTTSA